jgi:carboxypeptidase C (cathepsin A)
MQHDRKAPLSLLITAHLIIILHAGHGVSQDGSRRGEGSTNASSSTDEKDKKNESTEEPFVVTQHETQIAGDTIQYTATTGRMLMKTDEGEKKAHMFFVAYTRNEVDDPAKRPISFCFNGGPGSSSVWLHLGMLGPHRVKLRDDAQPQPPPFRLIPNEYSLLDVSDLVFIDPVSTGYSRPAEGEEKGQFHGYEEDLRSVGQFIHDYTSRYQRWASPKFLVGESYGGLRAAGLAGTLQERYRMYLNGIVMVSPAVDFQTLAFSETNDLPYILFFPSYAATAWYHQALDQELQELSLDALVRRAERFAQGPYARALWRGTRLSTDRREDIAEEMAELTGLSVEYVLQANLRVSMGRFGKELLRDRLRVVGRYDSRYTGVERDAAGEFARDDPSGASVFGAFTAALNDYMRRDLEYKEERVYEILTGNVRPWSYERFENRYVNASETLRHAMTSNPYLKVFVACGHYDLATPQFAMKYTRDHLGLAEEVRDNIQMEFYPAGHMMYVYEPSLVALRDDLMEFYEEALTAAAEGYVEGD